MDPGITLGGKLHSSFIPTFKGCKFHSQASNKEADSWSSWRPDEDNGCLKECLYIVSALFQSLGVSGSLLDS